MKFQKIFSILFSVILLPRAVFALSNQLSPEAPSLKTTPIITTGYLFQLFVSLAIVFGLMYLVSKYVLPKIKVTTSGRHIQVIDRVGLEPQVTAYVLKVQNNSWLIVSSHKNVSVVSKLEDIQ